jgi:hypothetical protein
MSSFFIDFEAFQHGDEIFRLKELCIIDVDNPSNPIYFLFKASKEWNRLDACVKRTYNYQMRHLHHLDWNEGITRYCRRCVQYIVETYFPGARNGIFYVMGRQKLRFLQEEFPKWTIVEYNVSINELPPLTPNINCVYRPHGEHCACLKCFRLVKHYLT